MAARRGKFSTGPTPYKVHFTNTEAGKTIAGTKRRVVWRFGWSDSEREHEVGLIHSVLSGKKTILENGREITAAHSVFSSDFSHGWESNGHLYRIEADTSNATDPIYTFTIDGVPFQEFQNKPARFDPPVDTKKADPPKPADKKPAPAASATPKKEERRPSQVSSFDPFSDSGSNTKSADAFGDFGSSSNTKPAVSKPAADFDFFGDAPAAPAPAAKSAPVDDFFSTPAAPVSAPAARPSASNDLLSDFSGLTFNSTSSSMSTPTSYVDPFAPAPAPSPAAANLLAANAPVSSPPVEPEKKDQWSGLVDLNLKGGNAPPRQTTQQSGPSLSMLSTNTSSTTSPAMVNRNSNAGFGTAGGFGNAPMPPPSFGAPAPSFGAPAPSFGAPAPSFGAPAPSFGAPAPSFGAPDPFASFAAQPPRPGGGFGGPVMGGPAMGSGMGMGMGSGMGGPGFSASNPSAGISMMGPGNPMGGPGMAPQGNANFGRPPATSSLDSLNWKM